MNTVITFNVQLLMRFIVCVNFVLYLFCFSNITFAITTTQYAEAYELSQAKKQYDSKCAHCHSETAFYPLSGSKNKCSICTNLEQVVSSDQGELHCHRHPCSWQPYLHDAR